MDRNITATAAAATAEGGDDEEQQQQEKKMKGIKGPISPTVAGSIDSSRNRHAQSKEDEKHRTQRRGKKISKNEEEKAQKRETLAPCCTWLHHFLLKYYVS